MLTLVNIVDFAYSAVMHYIKLEPKVLVLSGYGLNCEEEMHFAFKVAGVSGDIVHINNIISEPSLLKKYQILAIPGGFSYGDHTGSGNAMAWKIRNNIWQELNDFVCGDTLTIGICNGCQILVNLGLVPTVNNDTPSVACSPNDNGVYQCRWVYLKITNNSVWLKNIEQIKLPVAHVEGNFIMHPKTLRQIKQHKQIAMQYVKANGEPASRSFPDNPNGSTEDIAAITGREGRIIAMMPHPERAIFSTQREDWYLLRRTHKTKIPKYSESIKIFSNARDYFA